MTSSGELITMDNNSTGRPLNYSGPVMASDHTQFAPSSPRPSLFLSDPQRDLALDVLTYFFYMCVVTSVPLTVLNIVVFLQPSMRSAASTYIIGVSLAQLYVSVTYAAVRVMMLTTRLDSLFSNVFTLYVAMYGNVVAKRGAYVVMCLVSLERLHAVARPLHAKDFFLSKHSVSCTCGAFLLSAVFHVYLLTKVVVVQLPGVTAGDSGQGQGVYGMTWTDHYSRHARLNDAANLAAKVLLSYCVLVTQMILNVCTVIALRRHNASAKLGTSSADDDVRRQREKQMTVTILAATVTYVILAVPSDVHNMFYMLFPETYSQRGTYTKLYDVVGKLVLNLTLLSAAIDFVWFVSLSASYRRTLLGLFYRRRREKSAELSYTDQPTKTEEM